MVSNLWKFSHFWDIVPFDVIAYFLKVPFFS